jgi:DNA primase large subunit
MDKGKVFLNKEKAVRLLQEEIKNRMEKRLDTPEIRNIPEEISVLANELIKLAQDQIGEEMEYLPKVVVQEAFPPCINALFSDATQARHLSHIGYFTLTSFLVNIEMTPEALNELCKTFSDYSERLTRYQIEHITGERGSGTKYTCPQCSVLQTHGVCKTGMICAAKFIIRSKYYKRKQASTKSS